MKLDWTLQKISDIASVNANSYSTKENWPFVDYLDTGNITENVIDSIQHIDVKTEKLPSRARRKVTYNSIIYSTVRPNQRHFGIMKNVSNYLLVSTGFAVIDVNPLLVDADFLYFYLSQPDVVEHLHSIAEQSVSAYPSIKASDIENLVIQLPPLHVQCNISAVLQALDDKIALNSRINDNLQQQAQEIFKMWFVDYFPWGGEIPENWTHGTLGEFAEVKRGSSPRPIQKYLSPNGLRWLKISDVTSINSPFIISIKDRISKAGLSKTVYLQAGSLVLSNSGTPGIPKFLDVDSCIHDGWLYFPKSDFQKEYLYLFFKYIRQKLVSLSNGSVFNNLKTDILKTYPVILPSQRVLEEFSSIVCPLFEMIRSFTNESYQLSEIRDALLPRLMSGELDVSDMEL